MGIRESKVLRHNPELKNELRYNKIVHISFVGSNDMIEVTFEKFKKYVTFNELRNYYIFLRSINISGFIIQQNIINISSFVKSNYNY